MNIAEKKLHRLISITKEVQELHPVLQRLLPRIPGIEASENTHGVSENGADFVLTKRENGLNITTYVGVIVKCGNIAKAEIPAIDTQIEQCEMERTTQGGKKKILISEIWVITNGTITPSAQEFIHHKFATQKIIFIARDHLITLIDDYLPSFWSDIDVATGDYLSELADQILNADKAASLIPEGTSFYIEQDITRFEENVYSNQRPKSKKDRYIKIHEEILANKTIMIEGDAGIGKSKLLRQIAIHYCQPLNFNSTHIVPVLTTFKELREKFNGEVKDLLEAKCKKSPELLSEEKNTILLIIDAADEVKLTTSDLMDEINKVRKSIEDKPSYKVLISSRFLNLDIESKAKITHIKRLQLQPLSTSKVIDFLKALCSKLSASDRIFEDLKRSQIFSDLPKSPIAAILLATLIKEKSQELPSTLPELYSKYFEIMLGRWEIEKGLQSQKEYDVLNNVLMIISAYLIENELTTISIDEAKGFFSSYLSKRNLGIDVDDFFNRACSRHNILILDRSSGIFGFKHRTFAEFLYAKSLLNKNEPKITNKILDIYWLNTFYFYVGLRRDCPEIIDQVSALKPDSEPEIFAKIFNLSSILLAGYTSPYESIKNGVLSASNEAAKLFLEITESKKPSLFSDLSEMRLLWLIQFLFKRSYGYKFFDKALSEAALDLATQEGNEKERAYSLFFLNVTHVFIGGQDYFDFILKSNINSLPLSIMLGIEQESDHTGKNLLVKKMDQNLHRWLKGNKLMKNKISDMFEKPIRSTSSQDPSSKTKQIK